MKKRQMAVCDEEPDYTRQFARYANRDREPLFLVHGYTDVQELIRDTKEHPAFTQSGLLQVLERLCVWRK